jgi:glycosyltransferase involved in cell wall biosynthesis
MSTNFPFISIVTPVYNGEKYLAECINSVLAQRHDNWEYIILDNCSTDATLSIAQDYARQDSRILVHANDQFVGVIENHNKAFHLLSPDSKYCKVVSADDWIYPDCVTRLVEVAEKYSSVGIVGSYAFKCGYIRGLGLPLKRESFTGHEVCRLRLLGVDVIGSPSSLLYRTSLVRAYKEFFAGSAPSADTDAIFRVLQHSEYGFVHQVLSYERVHEGMVSSRLMSLNSFLVDQIEFLVNYGPIYLNQDETETRLEDLLSLYYDCLASGIVNFRDREFWNYHKDRMRDIGINIDYGALAKATLMKLIDLALNPKQAVEKALRRVRSARSTSPIDMTQENFSAMVMPWVVGDRSKRILMQQGWVPPTLEEYLTVPQNRP